MREVMKEVVCIDGGDYPHTLTNGKTYSVVRVHDIYYDIIDDSGEVGDFTKDVSNILNQLKITNFFQYINMLNFLGIYLKV